MPPYHHNSRHLLFIVAAFLFSGTSGHATPSNLDSPLAINIPSLIRFNTDWPLIDEFKRADFITQCDAASDCWDTGEDGKVDIDQNGWVKSLTPIGGQSADFTKVSYTLFGGDYAGWQATPPPSGEFTVMYEGEGTLNYGIAAQKTGSCGTNCDLVNIDTSQGVALITLTQTDPNQTGNYLRNIQVIWPGGLCDGDPFTWYQSAADCTGHYQSFVELKDEVTFHPDFLSDLRAYKAIRFMDFQRTNESTLWPTDISVEKQWNERRHPDFSIWSDGINLTASGFPKYGAPAETMIDLVNILHADPWLNIPYDASDDYILQFATLVKQRLTGGQRVYIEYGNEAWNSGWPFISGGVYLEQKGAQLWPNSGTSWDHRLNYFAKRTTEMCSIWKQAWGSQSDRVECVMGGWAASSWTSENLILKCPLWRDDPGNPTPGQTCGSQVDALAIAPYFGGALGSTQNEAIVENWSVDDLFSALTSSGNGTISSFPTATTQGGSINQLSITTYPVISPQWRLEQLMADKPGIPPVALPERTVIESQFIEPPEKGAATQTASAGSLGEAQAWITEHAAITNRFGIDLLAYEGGQHLAGVGDVVNNTAITTLFRAANRDPRMGTLYTQYLDNWKQAGGALFSLYSSVSPASRYGSWGLKEDLNQSTTPKWAAAQGFISSNTCWWPGCNQLRYVKSLAQGQWEQLSLPCDPGAQNSVADIFADDIAGVYGEDWVVFEYDAANNQYIKPALTGSPLVQGKAYWAIQVNTPEVSLDMPDNCQVTPLTTPTATACTSAAGCKHIQLPSKPDAIQWSMKGYPFSTSTAFNHLRLGTQSGSCSTGCTMNTAATQNIAHNQIWHYTAATGKYRLIENSATLNPWDGYWFATLNQADGFSPKLIVPEGY